MSVLMLGHWDPGFSSGHKKLILNIPRKRHRNVLASDFEAAHSALLGPQEKPPASSGRSLNHLSLPWEWVHLGKALRTAQKLQLEGHEFETQLLLLACHCVPLSMGLVLLNFHHYNSRPVIIHL